LARIRRGLRQQELAKRAGLSSGYLSQLENEGDGARIRAPGLDKARALALALDVPLEWLAFGEGPEPTWEPTGGEAA
jgi:transcriptional regulator with XRE-family HTH domain